MFKGSLVDSKYTLNFLLTYSRDDCIKPVLDKFSRVFTKLTRCFEDSKVDAESRL